MTVWIVPVAMILVPAIVGCLAALWANRSMVKLFTEAFTITARGLNNAAQRRTGAPRTPERAGKATRRHSARQRRLR